MQVYENLITHLEKDEVFVWGANNFGFHGGGAAGFATFNKPGNIWREEKYDLWDWGTKGCWSVKGCASGLQIGALGKGYAIPTIVKPGAKKSIPLPTIAQNIKSFYAFALSQPNLKFYVARDAKTGLNGWEADDMVWAHSQMIIPDNVYFYRPFYDLMVKSNEK